MEALHSSVKSAQFPYELFSILVVYESQICLHFQVYKNNLSTLKYYFENNIIKQQRINKKAKQQQQEKNENHYYHKIFLDLLRLTPTHIFQKCLR